MKFRLFLFTLLVALALPATSPEPAEAAKVVRKKRNGKKRRSPQQPATKTKAGDGKTSGTGTSGLAKAKTAADKKK